MNVERLRRLGQGVQSRRTDLALFVAAVLILVLAHALLRTLALFGLPVLVVLAPVLLLIYTDRSRGAPQPEHFASFFAAVGVTGALLFLPSISIIAATALLALGAAWVAAHYALEGLEYERSFASPHLFPNDETELILSVRNRKLLPLAWFEISDPIHIRGGSGKHHLKRLLDISTSLELIEQQLSAVVTRGSVGPFQEMSRSLRVRALHRGVYAFGPGRCVSGDPFGIFSRNTAYGDETELVVYPRIMRSDEIEPDFWATMGSLVTRRKLFDDPSMLAGSREYRPDDPLRHVHWKATARTGALQVKIHDPSTTTQLMIVVNLQTFEHSWQGVDPERMEAAIEVAASLATWSLDRGLQVGLRSNGVISSVERTSRIAPSASPHQGAILLDHLARLSFSGGFDADGMLRQEAERRGGNTSIVFVTPVITPSVVEILQSVSLRNRASVLYCGRFAAPMIPGVSTFLAAPLMEDGRAVS